MAIENVGEFIFLLDHAMSTLESDGKISLLSKGKFDFLQELQHERSKIVDEVYQLLKESIKKIPMLAEGKTVGLNLYVAPDIFGKLLASFLVNEAVKTNPSNAVNQLNLLLALDEAPCSIFTAVYGADVKKTVNINDHIRLLPTTELPEYSLIDPSYDMLEYFNLPYVVLSHFFIEQKFNVKPLFITTNETRDNQASLLRREQDDLLFALSLCCESGLSPRFSVERFHNSQLSDIFMPLHSVSIPQHDYLPSSRQEQSEIDVSCSAEIFSMLQKVDEEFHSDISDAMDMYIRAKNLIDPKKQAFELSNILEYFLQRGQTSEIAHSIGVRTAWLIEKNLSPREEIYKTIKYLYDARSKFVHGNRETLKPKHLEAITESFIIVEKVILELLTIGRTLNEKELRKIDLGMPPN